MSDAENMCQRLLDIFDGDRATFADRLRFIEYLDGIEAENERLRQENQSIGMAAYELGRASLADENAKLWELVRHMYECMSNVDADGNYECYSCEYENTDGGCNFERMMRELGIEVE